MKALLIYLNGRPTTRLEARGLCRRGVLVRTRKGEEPFPVWIDEGDPKGERRARGVAVSWISHMIRLRAAMAKTDGAFDFRAIPNVRRLLAGLSPRWKGSRQWRIHLKEFPAIPPVNETTKS